MVSTLLGSIPALQFLVPLRTRCSSTQQLQATFVAGVVAGLVGIDEGKVAVPGGAGRELRVERLKRRGEAQVDLVRHAGLAPTGPADTRVVVADVAGQQPPVVRHGECDGQGAAAGGHATLIAP